MEEKIIHTEQIYNGRVIKLNLLDVELPDGKRAKREVVKHPGAVAIVALDADQKVLMVRQFRIAAGQVLREIPAGTLNPNEAPDVCARRELQEETGYLPEKLESLGGFYVAPGYTSEYIHLFLANHLIPSRLPGDEDEFIELDRVTLAESLAMIERGEIIDGKSISGLLRVARRMGL